MQRSLQACLHITSIAIQINARGLRLRSVYIAAHAPCNTEKQTAQNAAASDAAALAAEVLLWCRMMDSQASQSK